jgi:hypothetical protein
MVKVAAMVQTRAQDTLIHISEFAGRYPTIPLPNDMLREFGEDALFVTLPIGKVGARSRNGRTYSRTAVQAIVDAVNTQRPEGRWGHLRDDERGTRYDPPAIRWLAAMMDGDGMAWAKGIPVTAEAREHFRIAKIAGSRVGTSVYGYGQMEGENVIAFELETIDLADPNRVGIPDTAAHPMMTREQAGNPNSEDVMEITLKDVPEAVRQQILEQHNNAQSSERLTEMQTQITELQGTVTTLTTERDAARGEASKLLVTYARAKIAELVVLEPVRKLVERMVGIREQDGGAVIENAATVAAVDAAINSVIEDAAVKEMNKESLKEMMGPPPNPPMNRQQGQSVLGEVIPG